MESCEGWDRNMLVELLTMGEDQIRQLEAHLNEPGGAELCKTLAQKALSTFSKAISVAKQSKQDGQQQQQNMYHNTTSTSPESPRSASGSPRSDGSDRAFKDQERREMCKKRKTLPKWSNQVRVCAGAAGVEGPLDDGYSWRKYGQKDILGAKYPRGYYRCTHRNIQGCLATKQVQRSDEHPNVFDVTYRGEHTCVHSPKQALQPAPLQGAGTQQSQLVPNSNQQQQEQEQELLTSLRAKLKVKTEGLDTEETPSAFSFPSTPISCCMQPQEQLFTSPSMLDRTFMSSFSPSFISPATSESNYFALSPCQMSNGAITAFNQHNSESDFTEIISAVTTATNSPVVDIDFMLGPEPGDFSNFDPSNFFQL